MAQVSFHDLCRYLPLIKDGTIKLDDAVRLQSYVKENTPSKLFIDDIDSAIAAKIPTSSEEENKKGVDITDVHDYAFNMVSINGACVINQAINNNQYTLYQLRIIKAAVNISKASLDRSYIDHLEDVTHNAKTALTSQRDLYISNYIEAIDKLISLQDMKVRNQAKLDAEDAVKKFFDNLHYVYRTIEGRPKSDQFIKTEFNRMLRGSIAGDDKSLSLNDITPQAIRQRLISCATVETYKFDAKDHPDQRAIDMKLVEVLKREVDRYPLVKEYIDAVVKHTQYIPESVFTRSLNASFKAFEEKVASKPYAIILPLTKYGSEWWFLQQLFATSLRGKEPPILTRSDPTTDPTDVILVDDAIYSGGNMSHSISKFLFDTSLIPKSPEVGKRYTFHIIIPYVSRLGYDRLSEEYKDIADLVFYPVGGLIPTLNDLEPQLWERVMKIGNERRGMPIIRDLIPDRAHTLIYFDHRIAHPNSTATEVLERIVPIQPSREPLDRAEDCFFNYIKQQREALLSQYLLP